MNVSQKLELFNTLVKRGFKEIEVGFPSASNTEFTFNRRLIEEKRVPADVWLQASGGKALPANVLVAINMEYADQNHPVKSGDEVAFFPPVTGG